MIKKMIIQNLKKIPKKFLKNFLSYMIFMLVVFSIFCGSTYFLGVETTNVFYIATLLALIICAVLHVIRGFIHENLGFTSAYLYLIKGCCYFVLSLICLANVYNFLLIKNNLLGIALQTIFITIFVVGGISLIEVVHNFGNDVVKSGIIQSNFVKYFDCMKFKFRKEI